MRVLMYSISSQNLPVVVEVPLAVVPPWPMVDAEGAPEVKPVVCEDPEDMPVVVLSDVDGVP